MILRKQCRVPGTAPGVAGDEDRAHHGDAHSSQTLLSPRPRSEKKFQHPERTGGPRDVRLAAGPERREAGAERVA